jgi:flagellar operon protein (TIGR03826 family)
MNLANCSRCGRVFSMVQGGREICPLCVKDEENNYSIIFQYLSSRPAATAQEISQATNIELKEVLRFVRENRLRLVKADTGLLCENCGISISIGKYCEKCGQKLTDELRNEVDKIRQNTDKPVGRFEDPPDPRYLRERRK